MTTKKKRPLCPRCNGPIPNAAYEGRYPGALSRVDSQTEICSSCGTDEAIFNLTYPGMPLPPLDGPAFIYAG